MSAVDSGGGVQENRSSPGLHGRLLEWEDTDPGSVDSDEMSMSRMDLRVFTGQKKGVNLILMSAFIIGLTAEFLFRRASADIYMRHYRDPLNFVLVAACTVLFFAVVLFFRIPVPNRTMLKWFFLIALLDACAFSILVISAAFVSVPVSALLMQGVIPISMGLSVCIFKRRFRWQHYVGCLLILTAVGLTCAFPTEKQHETPDDRRTVTAKAAFWWGFVHLAGNIPSALSGVCKEMALSHPDDTKRADLHSLNAYVALFQCLITLLLSPLIFYLHTSQEARIHGTPAADEVAAMGVFNNFKYGFECLFEGSNHLLGDDCHDAWWMVGLHIISTTAVNIVALLIIYKGSAVIFFIASAVTIPLTHLVSMAGFMGPLQVEPNYMDILVTFLCLLGVVAYRAKKEE